MTLVYIPNSDLSTRVLEIRQREIRQRRWKFVNGVGNSSTAFLSQIFRWKFVNNFSFLNPNFSVDSYQKNVPLCRNLLESILINCALCQFVNQKQLICLKKYSCSGIYGK